MEDLAQSWNKLTLSDREGPGCCLLDDDRSQKFAIAAKFLTRRAINMEVIAKTFNPLWRAKNGFKIQSFGDHKVLFIFDNMEDVDRILEGEPWTFDKHLVVMNRYENDSALQDIKFEKTKLWVQLHGLPIKYMTIEAAKKIGSVLGEIYVPTNPKFFDGGHFVRVQAPIDLSLPLCRGRLVSIGEGGKQVWIAFKYERLPNLCYWCGRLTHDDRDCDLWIDSEGTLKPEQREFGPNLRALPFVPARRNAITVPGFYAAKKKARSGTPEASNSGQNSDSGSRGVTVQMQEVTGSNNGSNNEGIEEEDVESLKRFEGDRIMECDTVDQNKLKDEIIGVITPPKETEIEEVACNEELCLAAEFGAAKIVDLSRKAHNKNPFPGGLSNPSARDNLSGTPSLKLSRDTNDAGDHTLQSPRVARTWTRRERPKPKSNTAEQVKGKGKKRMAASEVSLMTGSSKRLQVVVNDDEKLFVVAGADGQPRQGQ